MDNSPISFPYIPLFQVGSAFLKVLSRHFIDERLQYLFQGSQLNVGLKEINDHNLFCPLPKDDNWVKTYVQP